MAFVGDIHGDGYDDVIISELFASTTPYHSGKVHVVRFNERTGCQLEP